MLWPNENPDENSQIYAKFVTLSKISKIYALKVIPFLDFVNLLLPLKKYPLSAKIGTSMDVRFGREWWDQDVSKPYSAMAPFTNMD